jgi:hypothetical protein
MYYYNDACKEEASTALPYLKIFRAPLVRLGKARGGSVSPRCEKITGIMAVPSTEVSIDGVHGIAGADPRSLLLQNFPDPAILSRRKEARSQQGKVRS